MKILGPYKRKNDGRWTINIIKDDGRKTSMSYPKYLIEQNLGRKLLHDETVDHIDRDVDNNSLENLRVIERAEHAKMDAIRVKSLFFECPYCGVTFERLGGKIKDTFHARRQGKSGPFCSRRCAGKYGAAVQNDRMKKLDVDVDQFVKDNERVYYQMDKDGA